MLVWNYVSLCESFSYIYTYTLASAYTLYLQYREVAAAIVQHDWCWKDMMKMSATEAKTDDIEVPDNTEAKTLTPMRMLIEFMPGLLAKF